MSWMGEMLSTNYGRGSFDIVYVSDTPVMDKGAESEG